MWTHAPIDELLPGLRRIAETMPEAPSHMLWMNWGPGSEPPPQRAEMAYSVEDDTYIALYGVWQDAGADAAERRLGDRADARDGLAGERHPAGRREPRPAPGALPQRGAAAAASKTSATIHDPDRRFHSWMGLPETSG